MGKLLNVNGVPLFIQPSSDPEFPWLYATRIREQGIAPIGCKPNSANIYRYANFEVEFTVLQGTQNGTQDQQVVTYMELSKSIDAEFITDDRKYYYDAGPAGVIDTPIDGVNAGRAVPVHNITVSVFNWYGAPLGDETWQNEVGKVNSLQMRILWYTYPPKTLMFMGASVKQAYTNMGFTGADIDVHFKFRNNPNWNQRIDKDGTVRNVRIGAQGHTPPYKPVPFTFALP